MQCENGNNGDSQQAQAWTSIEDKLFDELIDDILSTRDEIILHLPNSDNNNENLNVKEENKTSESKEDNKNLSSENKKKSSKKEEKEEHYDSFREWLEMNRKIIELEKEKDELDLIEQFIQFKEENLLKKIISYSNPSSTLMDQLFFRKDEKIASSSSELNEGKVGNNFEEKETHHRIFNAREEASLKENKIVDNNEKKEEKFRSITNNSKSNKKINKRKKKKSEFRDGLRFGLELGMKLMLKSISTSFGINYISQKQLHSHSNVNTHNSLFNNNSNVELGSFTKGLNAECMFYNSSDDEESIIDSKEVDLELDVNYKYYNRSIEMNHTSATTNDKNTTDVNNNNDNRSIITTTNVMKEIYPTNQFIDKYHEGNVFHMKHLKDIVIGGDLPNGGSIRSVQLIKNSKVKQKMETLFGIEMSNESWIHFKNYIRKLIADYRNLDIKKTTMDKNNKKDKEELLTNLTLKENEFIQQLYPLSNLEAENSSINQVVQWNSNTEELKEVKKETRPLKDKDDNENFRKARKFLSTIKALKLLYGVSGYAESLFKDSFPFYISPENGRIIYSKESTIEERNTAIENEIRSIELKLVEAKNQDEFKRIQEFINNVRLYLSNPKNCNLDDIINDLSEEQWKELEDLCDDMGYTFQHLNYSFEEPITIEIASDQPIPKEYNLKDDDLSYNRKVFPIVNKFENYTFPNEISSWERVLSEDNNSLENNKLIKEEIDFVKQKIENFTNEEKTGTIGKDEEQSMNNNLQIERSTSKDTNWEYIDTYTKIPYAKNDRFLFNQPIRIGKFINSLKTSLLSSPGFKLFGVSTSDSGKKYDWNIGTRMNSNYNHNQRESVSLFGLRMDKVYDFIKTKALLGTKYSLQDKQQKDLISLFFNNDTNYDNEKNGLVNYKRLEIINNRENLSTIIDTLPEGITKRAISLTTINPKINNVLSSVDKFKGFMKKVYYDIFKIQSGPGEIDTEIISNDIPFSFKENNIRKQVEERKDMSIEGDKRNSDTITKTIKQEVANSSVINYTTSSLNFLNNTFTLDETKWKTSDLMHLAVGSDPFPIIEQIRKEAKQTAFNKLTEIGIYLPERYSQQNISEVLPLNIPTTIIEKSSNTPSSSLSLPRVNEIIKERFDKRSLLYLENTVIQMENKILEKSTSGQEPTTQEKSALQQLKDKVISERERLKKVLDTDSMITPMEQAKLEQLGLFESSVKILEDKYASSKEKNEEIEKQIMEREMKVLDQLLDQMNREIRRDFLLQRPKELGYPDYLDNLTKKQQEAIKNYSKLRTYYNNIYRKDTTLREWQSLTLKERQKVEDNYNKYIGGDNYQDILTSVGNLIQSTQFSETLTYISAALARSIHNSSYKPSEIELSAQQSLMEEKIQLENFTKEFIKRNGVEQRFKQKQRNIFRKLSPTERKLREDYNYDGYHESILTNSLTLKQNKKDMIVPGTTQEKLNLIHSSPFKDLTNPEGQLYHVHYPHLPLPYNILDKSLPTSDIYQYEKEKKIVKEILEKEFTLEELENLVKHQIDIQHNFKLERINSLKKKLKDVDNQEDPLFNILRLTPNEYLTFEQKLYYKRLYEIEFKKKLEKWREISSKSQHLSVAPFVANSSNANNLILPLLPPIEKENPSVTKESDKAATLMSTNPNDYWTLEDWKNYFEERYHLEKQPLSHLKLMNEPIFPEIPWKGSFKDLQLLYLKLQLERSHLPLYTRTFLLDLSKVNNSNYFSRTDGERFIHYSFWKEIWSLPESLSNFIYTSTPTPLIKRLPPPPPKKTDQKELPKPTITQPPPMIAPIIPQIPTTNIQPPPPPILTTMIPPQLPTIPPVTIPITTPPVQPPPISVQLPSQPMVIPQRTPITVNQQPIYPRYLLDNLQQRLFE